MIITKWFYDNYQPFCLSIFTFLDVSHSYSISQFFSLLFFRWSAWRLFLIFQLNFPAYCFFHSKISDSDSFCNSSSYIIILIPTFSLSISIFLLLFFSFLLILFVRWIGPILLCDYNSSDRNDKNNQNRWIFTHTYIYTYIHTYTPIHTHTYIPARTHTQINYILISRKNFEFIVL